MSVISKVLISVYDKEGIVDFAKSLSEMGVEILSSGGTAKLLTKSGIKVTKISDYTGFPEMMDGRVKTLHPKVHGAILAKRNNKQHVEEAKKNNIPFIDMVVVNLYPFEETVEKERDNLEKAIENIDIGGPTLVRAAAKNYQDVAVVVSPNNYETIIKELKEKKQISKETREKLALDAWQHVAHYDCLIERYFKRKFKGERYPNYMNLTYRKKQDLRYGENPHQSAAFYVDDHFLELSIGAAEQVQGKELSYNNILDGNAILKVIREFDEPTAVVVKHNNPSGVASNPDILEAFKRARAVDPKAAFGGVVCINKEVDKSLAEEITKNFTEIVIAPSYTKQAIEIFSKKKKLRILQVPTIAKKRVPYTKYRSVVGGLLVQEANVKLYEGEFKVVSKRKPTDEEMKALLYAWKVCKYVKSNSIVYAKPDQVIGIGAGQMKRIDAARIAAEIAAEFGYDLKGCAMASDAFFPFRDSIDAAAKRGIKAVIQPGGSIRDQEVIDAVNEHGMAMVFTGVRHFRH